MVKPVFKVQQVSRVKPALQEQRVNKVTLGLLALMEKMDKMV